VEDIFTAVAAVGGLDGGVFRIYWHLAELEEWT